MDIEAIKDRVIEILGELCAENVTDVSTHLINDLSMDSLRMVMLLVMLEESFEIELDESDMNPFALVTVEDIIGLVSKYKTESNGEENE